MQDYYVSFGLLQQQLTEYYKRTGMKMQFPEIIDYMYRKNMLLTEPGGGNIPDSLYSEMTDADFERFVDSFTFQVDPTNTRICQFVSEADIIPKISDVFVIRHPRYTRHFAHTHNYFEA